MRELIKLRTSVARAIRDIKDSEYHGTHIKVELEAHLDRYSTRVVQIDWTRNEVCQQYIDNVLPRHVREATVFRKFYNDGSVDSELTFTIPIDKPYMVISYIKAFLKLAKAIGHKPNVTGAGMHIAILNNSRGAYPQSGYLEGDKLQNFADSMYPLLPALFFLGTSNAITRKLRFRAPDISSNSKYAAIAHRCNTLEYRVFDTCYDKPEAFYDFLCVIAKTLQFYSATTKQVQGLKDLGKLYFSENGWHLSRFYTSVNHLKALDIGLAVLKPDHKSIAQLKKERNFDVNNAKLDKEWREQVATWESYLPIEKQRVEKLIESYKKKMADYYDREASLGFIEGSREQFIETEMKAYTKKFNYLSSKVRYVAEKAKTYRSRTKYSITL